LIGLPLLLIWVMALLPRLTDGMGKFRITNIGFRVNGGARPNSF
jgi:hypothetical protein